MNTKTLTRSLRRVSVLLVAGLAMLLIACGAADEEKTQEQAAAASDTGAPTGGETPDETKKETAIVGGFEVLVGGAGGGFGGDGGPATAAEIYAPMGVAVDGDGNVYVSGDHRVRKVDAETGIITTFVGTGSPGYGGDDGEAASAKIKLPEGVAVDANGNLYIADSGNGRIRKVDVSTGMITTVAGGGPPVAMRRTNTGDGGLATEAYFKEPRDVAVDSKGNIYFVAEDRVRKVDIATGVISTYAGKGVRGVEGDGGPANEAAIADAMGLAFDADDNLYIADTDNQRVRMVEAATGIIRTLAGIGVHGSDETLDQVEPGKRKVATQGLGYSGDGGPAAEAMMRLPHAVAVAPNGQLYIADMGNDVVRAVDLSSKVIRTAVDGGAVTGRQYDTDGYMGSGAMEVTFANFSPPRSLAVDNDGNIYIADLKQNKIVKYRP